MDSCRLLADSTQYHQAAVAAATKTPRWRFATFQAVTSLPNGTLTQEAVMARYGEKANVHDPAPTNSCIPKRCHAAAKQLKHSVQSNTATHTAETPCVRTTSLQHHGSIHLLDDYYFSAIAPCLNCLPTCFVAIGTTCLWLVPVTSRRSDHHIECLDICAHCCICVGE